LQHAHRIYLAAFLLDGALMTGLTPFPFFVYHHLQGTVADTGNIGSAQSLVYAVCCLASSLVVARIRNGMALAMIGTLLFGGLFAGSHLSSNLLLYSIGIASSTLGMSLVWPALHSWLGAEPDTKKRTKRMGAFNISWSFGLAVGPLLGGTLYDIDYRLPFIGVFVMSVAAALLLYGIPSERPHVPEPETPPVAARERAILERLIAAAWLANALGWALVAVTRMIFPKRMDDLVTNNALRLFFEADPAPWLTERAASLYGVLAFVLSFASCAMYFLLGRTHWWHGRFGLMVTLQLASGAALWALGHTHSFIVMTLCFGVIGVNCGLCFFAATYYCTANPEKKYRRLAINEGMVGLGGFMAPLAFGYLAEAHGVPLSFRVAPVLVIALVLVQASLLWWHRERRPGAPASP
jgi:MFS family permease